MGRASRHTHTHNNRKVEGEKQDRTGPAISRQVTCLGVAAVADSYSVEGQVGVSQANPTTEVAATG